MKNLTSKYLYLSLLLLLASCSKHIVEQDACDNSVKQSITAIASLSKETKTHFGELSDGTCPVIWNSGDAIQLAEIYKVGEALKYKSDAISSTKIESEGAAAHFNFEASVYEGASQYQFYAAYPKIKKVRDPLSITVNIGVVQNPLVDSPDPNSSPLFAVSDIYNELPESINLQFKHVAAYAKMTLKNIGREINSVKFEVLDDNKYINGNYVCKYEDGNIVYPGIMSGQQNYVKLNISSQGDTDLDVYFSSFPNIINSFKVSYTTTDGQVYSRIIETSAANALHLQRAAVTAFSVNMASAENENTETIVVAGIEWAKGNLQFVDDALTTDGFQTGWRLAPSQYHYVNMENAGEAGNPVTYSPGSYSAPYDHFNFGGINDPFSLNPNSSIKAELSTDISAKMYTDIDCATVTNDFESAVYGDLAYWASNGKYRLPTEAELQQLSTLASRQYAEYTLEEGKTITGFYFTNSEPGLKAGKKILTDEDFNTGLFLPEAGRRQKADEYTIKTQVTQGVYWTSTVITGEAAESGQCYSSVLSLQKNSYKFPYWNKAISGVCGHCIRPVLVSETHTSDVITVGEELPQWSEGYLDIHAINSGRGECTFYILPDGTSMLVDAGEILIDAKDKDQLPVAAKPNDDVRPYIVYANYIKHFYHRPAIDWALVSHYHIDHLGSSKSSHPVLKLSSKNGYILSGMTALYDMIPYNRILDNGYPSYNADDTIPVMDGQLSSDWIKFINWATENRGLVANRFRVAENQIKLVKKKDLYPNFSILNIGANGYIYDGHSITNMYAAKGNPSSNAFHISYGRFDYLSCGDLVGNSQNKMAEYYANTFTDNTLDAFKSNHHLNSNSWGSAMDAVNFSPKVVVSQSFYKKAPDIAILSKIINDKDIFITNVHPDSVTENPSLFDQVKAYNGHIVIRVLPGGDSYYVIILDDNDFNYKVKAIFGPYISQ